MGQLSLKIVLTIFFKFELGHGGGDRAKLVALGWGGKYTGVFFPPGCWVLLSTKDRVSTEDCEIKGVCEENIQRTETCAPTIICSLLHCSMLHGFLLHCSLLHCSVVHLFPAALLSAAWFSAALLSAALLSAAWFSAALFSATLLYNAWFSAALFSAAVLYNALQYT